MRRERKWNVEGGWLVIFVFVELWVVVWCYVYDMLFIVINYIIVCCYIIRIDKIRYLLWWVWVNSDVV